MSYDEQDQTAEVIEDYQSALDGLTMNSRFEITNLTQIARDLTNYAFPIAETLEQHIKKVGGLYLDSCVAVPVLQLAGLPSELPSFTRNKSR
jgi:pre-mRNA cleavage complex 2 protein Pcf11